MMSRYDSDLERAVLDSMVPRLHAEGFSVVIQPSGNMLPDFLRGYRPDLVAYKGDKKVAVEISSSQLSGKTKLLREIFAGHPDWELRLIYAPAAVSSGPIPVAAADAVETRLRSIECSIDTADPAAALLTAWAAFEAAARHVSPATFARPQPSDRLVEALAFDGYVTPNEADMLRPLAAVRDKVAHGELDLAPGREQVENLIAVTRSLLAFAD